MNPNEMVIDYPEPSTVMPHWSYSIYFHRHIYGLTIFDRLLFDGEESLNSRDWRIKTVFAHLWTKKIPLGL